MDSYQSLDDKVSSDTQIDTVYPAHLALSQLSTVVFIHELEYDLRHLRSAFQYTVKPDPPPNHQVQAVCQLRILFPSWLGLPDRQRSDEKALSVARGAEAAQKLPQSHLLLVHSVSPFNRQIKRNADLSRRPRKLEEYEKSGKKLRRHSRATAYMPYLDKDVNIR
jgi:hypothetical protein